MAMVDGLVVVLARVGSFPDDGGDGFNVDIT
jgi:hypothetical protein